MEEVSASSGLRKSSLRPVDFERIAEDSAESAARALSRALALVIIREKSSFGVA